MILLPLVLKRASGPHIRKQVPDYSVVLSPSSQSESFSSCARKHMPQEQDYFISLAHTFIIYHHCPSLVDSDL